MTDLLEPSAVSTADAWEDVRAITVRQPWAEAIADGVKLVENRSQRFPKGHRGLLLIHAGKGWSERGRNDDRIRVTWTDQRRYALRHSPAYRGRPPHPFVDGAVLAVVEVVDIHPAAGCCKPWGEDTYVGADGSVATEVTHLVLEDVRRLARPVPATGALGPWRPRPELVAAVRAQLP